MKKITIIALFATLVLSGCKNFLIEEPILTQSTQLALSDYNGLDKAIGGAYSPLASGSWYGAGWVLEAEMRAGNGKNPYKSDFRSGRMETGYTMNYNESSTSGLWGFAYYLISSVNNVIQVIDTKGTELIKTGVTQQDINNIKAEALALRALAHFDLMRTYATAPVRGGDKMGVPLILITDKSAKEMPARNTVAEVYTQIEKDLVDAEQLMADTYARKGGTDANSTFNKVSIQALLSRVYLYNQKWQLAADYATKVIDSKKYTLWSATEYATIWGKDAPTGEVIFDVYGIKANSYDAYWEGPSHMTNPAGYADCAASVQLTDLFEAGDIRGIKGTRGKAGSENALFVTDSDDKSGGELWTMKYQGKGLGDAINTPDVNNTILIRLSEMYLIRAEAIANGAVISGTSAVADINAIRTKRNASLISSAGPATVALERRLELNFEGHLWFDLARTTGVVDYDDLTVAASKHLAPDSKYWALPIPKRETDVNKNLVQNPGY